jgi:acetylornithine deacetylase
MLNLQWIGCCALAFASVAHFQVIEYDPSSRLEQPLQLSQAGVGQDSLFSLHRSLVNIESISGNEHDVGIYLERFLQHHNYTVERQDISPLHSYSSPHKQRFNILAYPGDKRQTRILLSSHIDTVPPHYGYGLREHDQIWGRGSVDAKACVATQFQAVQELLASKEISPNDASLLFVVGEEFGGDGMRAVNDLDMEWETVIFGEPTELKLASGHKGILIFTLKAHGKAGHSGYPWLWKSANHMLIPALAKLQQLELPSSEKYGNSTLNIGQIHGGVAVNVIAETASAKVGLRIAGGDPGVVKDMVLNAVKSVDEDLEIEFHVGAYGPVYIDGDVEGFDTITVNYGTDIPNLKGSHKRYLYGPGSILVAHSDHEHLKAGDLLEAVKGYKMLVKAALGSK